MSRRPDAPDNVTVAEYETWLAMTVEEEDIAKDTRPEAGWTGIGGGIFLATLVEDVEPQVGDVVTAPALAPCPVCRRKLMTQSLTRHMEIAHPGVPVPVTRPGSPFLNIVEYLADVPDNPPWLIKPLTYFGGVTLMAGIWKGGKSTLAMQLMRARETGEMFLEDRIITGPTVLVTEEGGIAIKHKAGGMSRLLILDKREATIRAMSFDDLLTALETFCAGQNEPALIVIDTLAVWGDIEDENDSVEVTTCIRKLAVLAQQTGAAILLIDHVRKDGGTHGRGIRGSGAKASTVDIYAVLDYPTSGNTVTDRVLDLEGRVIDPTALRLSFDPMSRRYDVIDRDDAALEEIERLLEVVPHDGPGMPVTKLALVWDMARKTAERKAAWIIEKGRMRRETGKIGHADGWLYWAIPAAIGTTIPRVERDDD